MGDQCSLEKQRFSGRLVTAANLRRLMDVLSLGMLLGVLVNMPYDQLFGLSATFYYALQSMISIFAFASLLSNWPTTVTIERGCLL